MFKQGDVLSRQNNDGCFFLQILWQNVRWFLSKTGKCFLEGVYFKGNRNTLCSSKKWY